MVVLVFHQFVFISEWRNEVDWINHYAGGVSFTYFVWKSSPLLHKWTGSTTTFGRLAYSFLAGCTAALMWDIGEFASDLLLDTAIQKSVGETMMDLVNGFLGTTTMVVILAYLARRTNISGHSCGGMETPCAPNLNSFSSRNPSGQRVNESS